MSKHKTLYFFISFVISFGVIIGIYIFYNQSIRNVTPEEIQRPVTLPEIEVVPEQQKECGLAHGIDYYVYEDSSWERNNKFGLYVYAENKDFFEIAQRLVNSNGGDWGYVLIPYNVKDRDVSKWSRVFDQLRNKHLIPIIQLWDVDVADYKDQTEEAAEFLNRFVWPVKERYISAYNEMNDARFWYGYVDPAEYAQILDYTVDTFKNENEQFFLMNGALNVSAPTNDSHLDAFHFMFQMDQEVPGIFNKLDGWASHSYPQPNFSGGPYNVGRWSIRAYEEELAYLRDNLGVEKELPVFITETGWAHAEGKEYNSSYLSNSIISEYFRIAFEEVWLPDERVRAVTPFTIKYNPPFDHFSWVNEDNVPYKHYDVVKSIDKVAGNPPHIKIESTDTTACE